MPDLTNKSTTDEAINTSGQVREPDLSPFSANLQSEHSESFSMMGLRECVGRRRLVKGRKVQPNCSGKS